MAQTSTSAVDLPDYLEKPVKTSLTGIEDWLNSDANYVYGSKDGESLWTDLSDLQKQSIGNVEWLGNQDLAKLFGIGDANSLIADSVATGNGGLSPERVVDENGWLGSIQSYINPYIQSVLDPTMANMREGMEKDLNSAGSALQGTGSYGDARHGLLESEIYRNNARDTGELSSNAFAQAFQNAMGLRSADMDRKLNADQTGVTNKMNAASGMSALGQQLFDMFSSTNDMMFNAGEVERGAEQERSNAMRSFVEAISSKKYEDALKLLGAATGAPRETTTTTEQKSDDGLWGLIGALAGAF